MITIFQCNFAGCPNEGIEYRMETETTTAECGGCHATLTGTKEK